MPAFMARAATSVKLAAGQRGDLNNAQFTASRSGGEGGFSWLLPLTLYRHAMPVDQSLARSLPGGALQPAAARGRYGLREFLFSPRLAWLSAAGPLEEDAGADLGFYTLRMTLTGGAVRRMISAVGTRPPSMTHRIIGSRSARSRPARASWRRASPAAWRSR